MMRWWTGAPLTLFLMNLLGLVGGLAGDAGPTPVIKTEAPLLPVASALLVGKDCPVYVHGELHRVRQHGEKWLNDGSDCEICTCVHGDKRCYYHYCNAGLEEGYMTPPSVGDIDAPSDHPGTPIRVSAQPVNDDDDGDDDDDGEEEASGMQPSEDKSWTGVVEGYKPWTEEEGAKSRSKKVLKVPHNSGRKNPLDNETKNHLNTDFCGASCKKMCPHGYQVDPSTHCSKCQCHKCSSLRYCPLQCSSTGYALDLQGCRQCQCLAAKTSDKGVYTVLHENYYDYDHDQTEDYFVTSSEETITSPSQGTEEQHTTCNTTTTTTTTTTADASIKRVIANERGHDSRSTSRVPPDFLPTRPIQEPDEDILGQHDLTIQEDQDMHQVTVMVLGEDGSTTKSAVQASPSKWVQLCLILVPLMVVFSLVALLAIHLWRRYHRDKYNINTFRPDEREKLRPVKTTDDDQTQVKHV